MTEWSFSQNIFLITKHLDLIFYRLLTWFHLRGKNRNNGQIPQKWKVGLFCQHTKQGQLDRTPANGFQRFKNAFLLFGKKDQGTTTSCIWTNIWGKWASISQRGGEIDSTCEPACSNAHTLSKMDWGPGERAENYPGHSQVINTPHVSLKQAAEYTWHIWVAGYFLVLGRKEAPDRFGRCKGSSVAESWWGTLVCRALTPSQLQRPKRAAFALPADLGCSPQALYLRT